MASSLGKRHVLPSALLRFFEFLGVLRPFQVFWQAEHHALGSIYEPPPADFNLRRYRHWLPRGPNGRSRPRPNQNHARLYLAPFNLCIFEGTYLERPSGNWVGK
eukprot:6203355-Pleurochrysis_carterae.AAC.1